MISDSFDREMGFTREEFFRLLPNALNGRPHQIDASGVSVQATPGTVRIDVGEQEPIVSSLCGILICVTSAAVVEDLAIILFRSV